MITDATLVFSTLQAITATAPSTDVSDLANQSDPGIGDCPLDFYIYVGTAFGSADGTATLQVQVQGAPDNGSGAPGSYVTITETDLMTVAQLVAQAEIPISLTHRSLAQVKALYRFLRLNYVVGTESFNAGTISAGLVINRDSGLTMGQYPKNYTVAP